MKEKLYVFDYDGLLSSSFGAIFAALSKIKAGVNISEEADYNSSLDLYIDIIKSFGVQNILNILKHVRSEMEKESATIPLYVGAKQILDEVGTQSIIVTDNSTNYVRDNLKSNDVMYKGKIIGTESGGKLKNFLHLFSTNRDKQLVIITHELKDIIFAKIAAVITFRKIETVFIPNNVDRNILFADKMFGNLNEFLESLEDLK
jgi:hypothetical protein